MMKFVLLLVISALCASRGYGQKIYGSTALNFNVSSNTAVADCETDLDSGADDGYYAAHVSCVVFDQNGTQVATGAYSDDGDRLGYAAVTLTFPTTPGITYTATSGHSAVFTTPADAPSNSPGTYFFDQYNFLRYTESPDSPNQAFYSWFGPGPPTETQRKTVVFPATQAIGTAPSHTTATWVGNFTGGLSAGDNLSFANATTSCQFALGLNNCPNYLSWNVELKGTVPDDVANWQTQQSKKFHYRFYVNSSTTAEDNEPVALDPIPSTFIQKNSGQKVLFQIDGPGNSKTVTGGARWDHGEMVIDLSTSMCTPNLTQPVQCVTYPWHVKLVVDLGGVVDSQTEASAGNISTSF